jgi:hypothetical protein
VRSVRLALDGKRVGRGSSARIDPKTLSEGEHRLVATVRPRRGRAKRVTLRFTVRECRSARLSATHRSRRALAYTDATLALSSGGPDLREVRVTLPPSTGAGRQLGRLRSGATVGTLTGAGAARQLRLAGRVRGTKPVILHSQGGVKVTIARSGAGAVVAVTGLPANVSSLNLRLNGRALRLVRNGARGSTTYSAELTDREGGRATVRGAVAVTPARKNARNNRAPRSADSGSREVTR